jgi:MFS family permease
VRRFLVILVAVFAVTSVTFLIVLARRAPSELSDPFILAALCLIALLISLAWTVVWSVVFLIALRFLNRRGRAPGPEVALALSLVCGVAASYLLLRLSEGVIETEGELTTVQHAALAGGALLGLSGGLMSGHGRRKRDRVPAKSSPWSGSVSKTSSHSRKTK